MSDLETDTLGERLARLAGLDESEIASREAGFHIVRVAYYTNVDTYVRAASILELALVKHGGAPNSLALRAAMGAMMDLLQQMERGSV